MICQRWLLQKSRKMTKRESDRLYTLLLRLNGPVQSWGSESLYDHRDTDYYPTKSGVLGMVAAALGLKRGTSLEKLNTLQFGVRIDWQGEYLKDFQITDMGKKLNKNLSTRVYLSDATFLVGLSTKDKEFLTEIETALRHPKYAIFLGRKACPPTMPLDMGIREKELYETLYSYPWLLPRWRQDRLLWKKNKTVLRIIMESTDGALKKDVPISFESNDRRYGYRNVKDMSGRVVCKENMLKETEHDPMKELGVSS